MFGSVSVHVWQVDSQSHQVKSIQLHLLQFVIGEGEFTSEWIPAWHIEELVTVVRIHEHVVTVLSPQLLTLDLFLLLLVLDKLDKGVLTQERDLVAFTIYDVLSQRELSLSIAQQIVERLGFELRQFFT